MRILPVILAALTLGSPLCAQYYAPDTEFHDRSQRTFPVEAARVLAWRQNLAGGKIASVTYEVASAPDGETTWKLRWLDEAKKPVREKIVHYPQSLLTAGPEFYRKVLHQITAPDWAISPLPAKDLSRAFWRGNDAAGFSRLEAVTHAGELLKTNRDIATPDLAAELAGTLAQGALPGLSTSVTLDAVLLSRAATWLAIAEASSGEDVDASWAPILFLAGREPAAARLWPASFLDAGEDTIPVQRMWSFLLRPHRAAEAFRFAAEPGNQLIAMPVMSYAANLDDHWAELIAQVGSDLLRESKPNYDYMITVATRGGVGGGHFAKEAPMQFLKSWETALLELSFPPLEDDAWRVPFKKAAAADSGDDAPESAHLQRLAPALNLGLDQHDAPLIPTAHITAQDLLGFGWEMAGCLSGAHYQVLHKSWGLKDDAREFAQAALGSVHGLDAFFEDCDVPASVPLSDFSRLEFTGFPPAHRALGKHLPASWPTRPDAYLRRFWLSAGATYEGAERLFDSKTPAPGDSSILDRLCAEGGPTQLYPLGVTLLNKRPAVAPDLRERVITALPWAIQLQNRVNYISGSPFDSARRTEALGWENLTAIGDNAIFFRYVEANAVPAAKRFYDEIIPFVTNPVGFSNTTVPARFTLAWWENDDPAMRQALHDGATYSSRDLVTQLSYAVHGDDLSKARQIITAIIERYGDKKNELAPLLDYLPLIPALKDPQNPRHEQAITGFPISFSLFTLQWMLARDARLTPEEGTRFLGGAETPHSWAAMAIAYLQQDKEKFQKLYAQQRWSTTGFNGYPILITLLRTELLEIPPKNDLPDLKPPGARPLADVLTEIRHQQENSELTAPLDLTRYKTADALWELVEKLKIWPARPQRSQEQTLKFGNQWLENQITAAEGFAKAWPKDPRRWDARLLLATLRVQQALLNNRSPANHEELDREAAAVSAAPDAPSSAKGEAAYIQIMTAAREVNPSAPHTFAPFYRLVDDYLAHYGSHPRAVEVAEAQIRLISLREQPGTENILKKLAAHPNEEVSDLAREALLSRERIVKLRGTPIDLKIPTTDGAEIDLTQWRGKVVLLDFWATWSPPCMRARPAIAKSYSHLHDRGFEIVGISLDQNRDSMDRALKQQLIPWAQHFDGLAFKGEISRQLGVRSIPAALLFDKKGLLRESELYGEELEAAVERLLKE